MGTGKVKQQLKWQSLVEENVPTVEGGNQEFPWDITKA